MTTKTEYSSSCISISCSMNGVVWTKQMPTISELLKQVSELRRQGCTTDIQVKLGELKLTITPEQSHAGPCIFVNHGLLKSHSTESSTDGMSTTEKDADKNLPDVKQQRQGGEAAYLKMCAFWTPTPWELLWFVGGATINSFSDNFSNVLLTWMRFHAIMHPRAIEKQPAWVRALVATSYLVFHARLDAKGGIGWATRGYFAASHPINQLAGLEK